MKLLSAKSRIAFGLVCLLVSVLSTAMMLGIVPERRSAVLSGRARLSETLAVACSDFISRGELRRLEFLLGVVVERNPELLSAGLRDASGKLVVEVGDHENHWELGDQSHSTESHIHVPIRSGADKWGSAELRFRALDRDGLDLFLGSPWLRLIVFCCAASYLLFLLYLRKMLAHLDPSQTVPKRVRTALDALAEGLLVVDREQRIVLANQSFASWVGRRPEKLIGQYAPRLPWVRNERGDPLEVYPWREAMRLERPQAGVMVGLAHEGEETQILIANASPVLGHDGTYRGVLVSLNDVTQLENTKRELGVAKKVAEDANQAKSEFLARMSHEIRTPMNAILGYTDVLRRGFDETVENRQEYLNTIHSSGEHLLALINDILDLSKVESGQMELSRDQVSPHELVLQVIGLLRSKADEKGVYLEADFAERLPQTITADSVRLRQTIVNLVGNAVKFTERGGVTLAVRCEPADAPRRDGRERAASERTHRLRIAVTDTGIGIPPSAQRRIFEPFAQADTSVTRKFGGTGLGLAISRQLAEAMGGGITLHSEPGRGSTFTVTIDVGPLEETPWVTADAAAAKLHHQSDVRQVITLPPARILVADDGESNRRLIQLVLTRAGAEVVVVTNGKQALEAALQTTYDIILMDMQMPVMDGYTATTRLRAAGYTRPIIALTAHAMRGDEEKCLGAGCSGFMTKPIDIDRMLNKLAEVLETAGPKPPASAGEKTGPASPRIAPPDPVELADQQVAASVTELAAVARAGIAAPRDTFRAAAQADSQAAAPGTREQRPSRQPLLCRLPLDDPDFLEIAVEFSQRLAEQLRAMRAALENGDFAALATLAHWLKGAGGTAGFDDFTSPADALQTAARDGEHTCAAERVRQLEQLASRIQLPAATG